MNNRIIKNRKFKASPIDSGHEADGEGTWAISYGDMVTLLLSFFIIFFSVNPNKEGADNSQKMKVAMINFLTENLKDENQRSIASDTQNSSEKNLKQKKSNSLENEKSEGYDPQAGNVQVQGTIAEEKIGRLSVTDKDKRELGLDKEVLQKWNGIAHDQGDHVIIEFKNVSFFKSGETKLTGKGEAALVKFAQVFSPYMGHFKVSIRAFTDTRQVRQDKNRAFKDNLELSALRGIASMRILQKSGIPLSRMNVAGYGELKEALEEISQIPLEKRAPAASEKEYAESLSRKIVIYIEPEVSK